MIFDDIYEKILGSNSVAIFSHMNSDADAIGSSIAMKYMLEKLGKTVSIFIQKPIHSNYDILGVKENIDLNTNRSFDLAISLDCPNTKRFGIYQKKFESIKNSVMFDHHSDSEYFADVCYTDSTCSSTCLMLYRFFTSKKLELDKNIATCLYAGIASDTGRFLFANLNSEVFEAVANLYEYGFDYLKLNYELFQKQSKNEFELLKLAFSSMKFFENDKICMCKLDEADFKKTGTQPMDTYKVIDYMLQINESKIAVLLSQNDTEEYLVSIRTKDDYNAQLIAKTFGGGGHLKASGCRLFTDGDTAFNELLNACKNELYRTK